MREPARPTRLLAALTVLGAALALVSGCAAATPVGDPRAGGVGLGDGVAQPVDYTEIPIASDVVYDPATGQAVDVCSPVGTVSDTGAQPAVLVVHGGSWSRGDKSDVNWRPLCQWLASEGFVAVSVDYRLAPAAVFPAQIDDVTSAFEWLRQPAQVERFGIDPDRIAAFGGSAGGNLASLLGTTVPGLDAVVDLSGPSVLTAAGLADDDPTIGVADAVRTYLDCPDLASCPQATAASPLDHVDAEDPAFFIAHAEDERVALSQSASFAAALEDAGVEVDFRVAPGALHSIAMLDDTLRGEIVDFLHEHLAAPRVQTLSIESPAP